MQRASLRYVSFSVWFACFIFPAFGRSSDNWRDASNDAGLLLYNVLAFGAAVIGYLCDAQNACPSP